MSTFATPIVHGTTMTRVTPSSPVPDLRYKGDRLMWIGVVPNAKIAAFASGSIARASGATNGIPGNVAAAWTLFQLSPLPQLDAAAFKAVKGGLPIQIIAVMGSAATPEADDFVRAGTTMVTAPTSGSSPFTAFMAFAFQDRLCRDPLTQAEAIAASGACDAQWPQYLTDLAALSGARNLRILDARGFPIEQVTVAVEIDTNPAVTKSLTHSDDGDTGISVPATSHATITATSAAHAIVATGDTDTGTFETALQLATGARMAQVTDADLWLTQPDSGVLVKRWNQNSFTEPIVEGTPYFTRLVSDMRSAKGGGAVELAGWAFVKGSLTDKTVDWPLVASDPSTTIVGLVNELQAAGVNPRFLVNQFMQFDSPTLDDFPELPFILLALYASLSPLQALLDMQTDPAGYAIGMLAVQALTVLLAQGVTLDMIKSAAEYSIAFMDAVKPIDPNIATWTPYPAAFADNPLIVQPPQIHLELNTAHTIDDLSHLGVYHQKFVNIRTAAGEHIAYLGGIDINSDRPDTPLHHARAPFHDVQVRITGPAARDVIRTYEERASFHNAQTFIPTPSDGSIPAAGSHLVQIARTYFKASPFGSTTPFPFAPSGETTPVRTMKAAMAQARDFIYLEDQYFTPPDDYVNALISAASNQPRPRALMITMTPMTDQPYGEIRRNDTLNALQNAWGDRFYTGTPLRRFLHETPALTTNLGRMRLASPLNQSDPQCDVAPLSHVPEPPFWAFIGNELVLVHAKSVPLATGDTATQTVEILRASGTPGWGAQPVAHPTGTPVLAVQIPGIYVHAKVMIVDDAFVFVGSSNINRRGLYHDGEMNSFTIPQHLKGDPKNPARILRCRLMAEHAGISAEMGLALFADPISAIPFFAGRSWYQGAHRQPLNFFGSLPPDVPLGTADSIGGFLLKNLLATSALMYAKNDVWPLLSDPTTTNDPNPAKKGPEFP